MKHGKAFMDYRNLKVTEQNMTKEIIRRLEELVEEIAECYTSIPEDILVELNDLTKNDWSEEEYIEFCAEYWCSSSLEETVYALLHGGRYPECVKKKLNFIRPLDKAVIPTLEIRHKLCECKPNDSIREEFEELPMDKIEKWFTEYFAGWNKQVSVKEDKEPFSGYYEYGNTSLYFEFTGEREYGFEKSVGVSMSNDKMGFIWSTNLKNEEWNDIIYFFNKDNGYTVLEK